MHTARGTCVPRGNRIRPIKSKPENERCKELRLSMDNLVNEHEVARICGLSVASVRRWRVLSSGPRYMKIGAAVRYRVQDIALWLESRPTGGGQ